MLKLSKLHLFSLLLALTLFSSCEIIGGIFKAGAYVGIIAVLVVLGLIFWLFSKFNGKG